ncbi:MAG TPA: UDP-glucose 4-epimerase GalE [Mariprofundaceae bacterium]|nr:UDP-glucose 4-epimerase GalE [Mariprofundaceae bacterium]
MKILVTGGAGYIGSHVVAMLAECGHEIIVFDNLSTGFRESVLAGELVQGDLADDTALSALFESHEFDAVMHFAASVVVPESVREPLKYYSDNTRNTLNLLQQCQQHRIRNFVFSSSAAVYGEPADGCVSEDSPLLPMNPYGASKMMGERMLMDLSAASGLNYVIFRYFNVAGADIQGRLGQSTENATHLIKVSCEAAAGKRPGVTIFGDDYPTPDGTCIRDYIHVQDLARAHLDGLDYLVHGGASDIFNCGYGHGCSVREVVDTVQAVTGNRFDVQVGGRRPGDPDVLVADATRIRQVLGWRPQFDDLKTIVKSAFDWEVRIRR